MWEGWNKYTDTEHIKTYGLIVGTNVKFGLKIGIYQVQDNFGNLVWHVQAITFAPSAGDYIIYDEQFANFEEAEARAWKEAQAILENAR